MELSIGGDVELEELIRFNQIMEMKCEARHFKSRHSRENEHLLRIQILTTDVTFYLPVVRDREMFESFLIIDAAEFLTIFVVR